MTFVLGDIEVTETLGGGGSSIRRSVKVASIGNINLATDLAGATIDGIVVSVGDRILLKDQSLGIENGLYIVQSGASNILRANDYSSGENAASTVVYIQQGTVNSDTGWLCTNNDGTAVIGTDPLLYIQITGTNIGGDVTAASDLTAFNIVTGDDGFNGVKSSQWTIDTNEVLGTSTAHNGFILDINNTLITGGGNGIRIRSGEQLGDISFHISDSDNSFQIMEVESDRGYCTFGKTYAQTLIDNGIVHGIDIQHIPGDVTDFNTQNGIYRIGGVDVVDVTQTLTNKTITSTTNNIAARSLHNTTTVVDISNAAAPTVGQVLMATSPTAATWQDGGDVVGPQSSIDQSLVRFNGTTGTLIESVGVRHYGPSATDPISPPPSAGDEYYNTVITEKMIYDSTRGKWLSTTGYMDGCGVNGSTAPGSFYRRWNGLVLTANTGAMIQKGTIVKIGYTSNVAVAHTLEILIGGVVVTELASGGSAQVINTNINVDYESGNISFRNKAGSATVTQFQSSIYYKLRA